MLADDIRVQGWRLGALGLLVFAACGILLNRLWSVQVVNSAEAQERSEVQTTVKNRLAPARGAICDRNGVMLAENRPSFDIDFYLGDLRRGYAETHKGKLPRRALHLYFPLDDHPPTLKITTDAATRVTLPDAITDWQGDGNFTQDVKRAGTMLLAIRTGDKTFAVRALQDNATAVLTLVTGGRTYKFNLAADSDATRLITFYPAGEKPPKAAAKSNEDDIVEIVRQTIEPIRDTLGLTEPLSDKEARDIREHFRTDPDLPYHYKTDLDFATVANFEERNIGVNGISIAQNPAREYTYGAFAAHILGYVGKPDNQNEHLADDGTPYETVGRHGIEALMDAHLQGEPGSEIKRVSSQGYYIDDKGLENAGQKPTMGATLYLTIDARIQNIVETALRHHNVGRGAAIVMDPRNGDVLAMASVPDYDPNKFIPKIQAKDWDALNQDPTAPLYNRALHAYPPGSTYKIMVALAGLKSGNCTPDTSFDCPGAIQIDDHLFHNSDSSAAGVMSLIHAICVSSDVYFYQYGIKAGIDAIDAMGKLAGFGHKWGLVGDGDEDSGVLPGPQWMKDNDKWLQKTHNIDHWSRAQTANTSIGQGFVLCTPLQMATFLCGVANGGTIFQPRLYSRVVSYDGKEEPAPVEGQVYGQLGVRPSDLKAVQEGMRQVVAEGTAQAAQGPGYQLAGKTGTAQAWIKVNGEKRRDLKCWFYCYGPFEAPRYVTCVVVEGGVWGGTTTAPIAQEIMSRLFAMDKGAGSDIDPHSIAFLQPAAGNFDGATVDTGPTAPANPPVDPSTVAANGDTPSNNDASVVAPAADAPPPNSARNSNAIKPRH